MTMESDFGKRLFRTFLLFSLIPAVLLTLFGFYLAVETSGWSTSDNPHDATGTTGLTNYYNDYLFSMIDMYLTEFPTDTSYPSPFPDFMFEVRGTDVTVYRGKPLLPMTAIDRIIQAGADRDRGFVETESGFIQFTRTTDNRANRLYAGIIHNPEYSQLATIIQDDYASRVSVRELRSRYMLFLAMIFATVSVLAVVIAYFFSVRLSRSFARPLAELSRASREIAAGNFHQEVHASGVDEIRALTDSFNQMARQLESTAKRLSQTERVAAWRNVARRFAHELKNPLQPILVSLYRIEKLLKGTSKYDEVIEPLQAASEELKHLTNLADRFSELAKLPPPNTERIDLSRLLRSIAKLYQEQLAVYAFTVKTPDEPVYVKIDPTYFRETLHNLLQNAIDASPKTSAISLELCGMSDRVDIIVQDFGQGMSSATISSARHPYFTTKQKGTGLGLAIVEKVVTETGGWLSIDSEEGQGTKVTISLPRER